MISFHILMRYLLKYITQVKIYQQTNIIRFLLAEVKVLFAISLREKVIAISWTQFVNVDIYSHFIHIINYLYRSRGRKAILQ